MKSPKTIADLKGARYNPRTITPLQLKKLQKSFERFGDLSGVVFNAASGVLVSGHQRMKTVKDKKTKIVKLTTNKKPDSQGTLAVGHIEVHEPDGSVTKIPYREVHWTDRLAEKAANIAANAAGGEFDQAKLGAILVELEEGQFDIETTSVDAFTTAKAIGKFKKSREEGENATDTGTRRKSSGGSGDDDDDGEGFGVVDPDAMQFAHCCPKCGYQWGDPDKATAVSGKATSKGRRSKAEPPIDDSRERVVKSSHRPDLKAKSKAKSGAARKPVAKTKAPVKKATAKTTKTKTQTKRARS